MAVVKVALGSEPLLLLGSGSKVVDRLPGVWLMMPVAGTTNFTWRLVLLPLVKLGIVGKVTTPVTASSVPLLDALTPVKPGMMLSVITTFSAAFGLLLAIVIV